MSWQSDLRNAAQELGKLTRLAEEKLGMLFEDEKDTPEDRANFPEWVFPSSLVDQWARFGELECRLGQIVHYRSHGSKDGTHLQECRPAVVSRVKRGNILSLMVIGDQGIHFRDAILDVKAALGGTWHLESHCG